MSGKDRDKNKKPKTKKKENKEDKLAGYFRLTGNEPESWKLTIPQTKIVLGRSGSMKADVQLGESPLISRFNLLAPN